MGGGSSTTVTVTYNDTTNTYSYNSSTITFKVPKDIEYTITVADNDNYRTPKAYSRTAIGGNSISITISYLEPLPDNGVYIYGADGRFYTTDNWNPVFNATGVAVITDTVRLIVAPDAWKANSNIGNSWNGNERSVWGGYEKTVSNIVTARDYSYAITDFAGSFNTDQIISQLSGTTDIFRYTGAPAAEYCGAYSSGCKGAGEWYLPAAGEANVLLANKDAINTALTKISGKILSSYARIWTSTQYDDRSAWCYDPSSYSSYDSFNYTSKGSAEGVWPVCQL